MDRFGLPDETMPRILRVLSRQEGAVERVMVFGSRAKGNYRPGSDIDICLVAPMLDLPELNRIALEIDDLDLPWRIDLLLMHQIDNPDLLDHIKRVGHTVFLRPIE